MQAVFGSRKRRDAQALVFFLLAWGMIMLLAGLAIDSGLLYLAKARMGRAVDGAALAAVGNFNQVGTITGGETQQQANQDAIALIMRNFAVANFTDLSSISTNGGPPGGTAGTGVGSNGQTVTTYTYNYNDGTQDANGAYRRFVQVTLTTGSGGAITSATCNARCPVQTYFIGYATYAIGGRQNVKIGGYSGPSGLVDLKVSSSAVATRNPRLIMIVLDRSASMLGYDQSTGLLGGATGLAPAVVQFLDFFDTSSDNIGIVSFGTAARLEMPMTTNFLIAGTNNLIVPYNDVTNGSGNLQNLEPGLDPEDESDAATYDATGVRRLKFGGTTCADDGIRMAMEQMMANPGFNDPDVVKYMVIFTDGRWNTARTLFAAPGYVNSVVCATNSSTPPYWTATLPNGAAVGKANGAAGPWSTNLVADTNIVPVPTLSPMPDVTNAIAAGDADLNGEYYANYGIDHLHDVWLSADGLYEPLATPAQFTGGNGTIQGNDSGGNTTSTSQTITSTTWVGTNSTGPLTNYFTHNLDVWLQPGAVDYIYHNGSISNNGTFVSDYTKPTQHINVYLNSGDSNVLVVPGYIADGTFFDGLDLGYPDNSFTAGTSTYPSYRADNFQQPYMWEDDPNSSATAANSLNNGTFVYHAASLERQLMFRNYANLLTGFYVSRPDYPLGSGIEPLITDAASPGSLRPQDPLGPYYPSAAFYWPFGGGWNGIGNVTNADGVEVGATFSLINPLSDPGVQQARHDAYSENMLSTNAAPEWAGELFYKGSGGVEAGIGNTAVSQIMVSSDWQVGAPPFVTALGSVSGLMVSEAAHNTSITPNPSVWRPASYNGLPNTSVSLSSVTPGGSQTGGWVSDGNGHYYPNAMAWSGRPTHYFDFSQGTWVPISDNHDQTDTQALPLGNWKAEEYAWHARAQGVTIYTVGYGQLVYPAQCTFLAEIANSTNVISPTAVGSTTITTNSNPYNASQPIGQQFYATTSAGVSNDFYSIGQAINEALTGGH
jgi:Flp pilus assembly protein TadG